MVPILGALIAGGAIASSALTWRRARRARHDPDQSRLSPIRVVDDPVGEARQPTALQQRTNRALAASSVALGATVAGAFTNPVLLLAGLPVSIYVFAPTFHEAWRTVRAERRVTSPLLDATRVTVCLVMGFYGTLALDAWLRTLTARVLLRTEDDFIRMLDARLPAAPPTVWRHIGDVEVQQTVADLAVADIIHVRAGERIPVDGVVRYGVIWTDMRTRGPTTRAGEVPGKETVRRDVGAHLRADTIVVMGDAFVEVTSIPSHLDTNGLRRRVQQAVDEGTLLQQAGVKSGRTMAPRMLALAGITLPFWGPNRAAGFVTTTFGSQMQTLGRYTLQNFVNLAAEQNVLIFDGRVLETANVINTVVINAHLLDNPGLHMQAATAIDALRRQRRRFAQLMPHGFAVYVMAERDDMSVREMAAEIGADDYFIAPTPQEQATILQGLQHSGRFICYVGTGQEDAQLLDHAMMAVAVPITAGHPGRQAYADGISAVVTDNDLARLPALFDLAAQFTAKQGFNLAWPLAMDLLDIGTTVFIHFGLIYSISFSYAGLLASTVNSRMALVRYRLAREAEQHKSALPSPRPFPH